MYCSIFVPVGEENIGVSTLLYARVSPAKGKNKSWLKKKASEVPKTLYIGLKFLFLFFFILFLWRMYV